MFRQKILVVLLLILALQFCGKALTRTATAGHRNPEDHRRILAGGEVEQDVNRPDIKQLAVRAIIKFNVEKMQENDHPYIVKAVLKSTSQVVSGLIYRLTFLAVPSQCTKSEWVKEIKKNWSRLENCAVAKNEEESTLFKAQIWEWFGSDRYDVKIDVEKVEEKPSSKTQRNE